MTIPAVRVLAHPEDEACAAPLRRYLDLAEVPAGTVVLVASADALSDDAIFADALAAQRRGVLRVLLWRVCLVVELDPGGLAVRRDRVTAVGAGAPPFYPRSGRWLGGDPAAVQGAAAELVRDLILAGGGAR